MDLGEKGWKGCPVCSGDGWDVQGCGGEVRGAPEAPPVGAGTGCLCSRHRDQTPWERACRTQVKGNEGSIVSQEGRRGSRVSQEQHNTFSLPGPSWTPERWRPSPPRTCCAAWRSLILLSPLHQRRVMTLRLPQSLPRELFSLPVESDYSGTDASQGEPLTGPPRGLRLSARLAHPQGQRRPCFASKFIFNLFQWTHSCCTQR